MANERLVNCVVDKITEESKDSSTYRELAELTENLSVKKTLLKIAADEEQHKHYLIQVLALLAKGVDTEKEV